ncbi:leucine-rich repeat and WD repeat-containing protein 1-like isoform X2 [Limulus polyphemus]|nr:leucine-rich repeat and WD repeat-containing protein 1-like isoform X2 [Limulus polyphemus]XP_022257505.1 leucine-rich repeat and WD repeat-containing protein 1-like isoform X2 [Limulus polyphemus]
MIQDISFLHQFPQLKELFLTGNPLSNADRYIAVAQLPTLVYLDGKDCSKLWELDVKVEERLWPQVIRVWEEYFANQINSECSEEDVQDLLKQMVRQLRRTPIHCYEAPEKFKRYKVESIATALILTAREKSKKKVTPSKGQRVQAGSSSHSETTLLSVKTSRSPVKKRIFPSSPEKESISNVEQTPKAVTASPQKKIKVHSHEKESYKLAKHKTTPEKQSVLLLEKVKSSQKYNLYEQEPQYSPQKQRDGTSETAEKKKRCRLPSNFAPHIFLRCHSRNNDPEDSETQVWRSAFEPDVFNKGSLTNTVATCGGNLVCLIDCESGRVIKRYKHINPLEDFYTLCWTSVDTGKTGNNINLLAVGGRAKDICLLHPSQLICYHSYKAHTQSINSLLFHPTQTTWLLSGGEDRKVHLWDVGIPSLPDYKTNCQKLMTLETGYPVLQMVFSLKHQHLLVGCEGGLFGWDLPKAPVWKVVRDPAVVYQLPKTKDIQNNEDYVVDGLALLSADRFAVKYSGSGRIYICSLIDALTNNNFKRKQNVQLVPLKTMEWSKCDTDYLALTAHIDGLFMACGDDIGQIWMYKTNQSKSPSKSSRLQTPAYILSWPDLSFDSSDQHQFSLQLDKVLVNSMTVSEDGQFLMACTSKNLVCLWKAVK